MLDARDRGGHVAWVLAAGAGWPIVRRRRVLDVIERHMWTSVDPAVDPEGHLLEIQTGLDISGARAVVLPTPFLNEVLTCFPRLGLAANFRACLVDQAAVNAEPPPPGSWLEVRPTVSPITRWRRRLG